MTKLLEQAISQVRELSEAEQDAAAEAIFAHISGDDRRFGLTPEQVRDVERIRKALSDGTSRLATDEEIAEFWKKLGA